MLIDNFLLPTYRKLLFMQYENKCCDKDSIRRLL